MLSLGINDSQIRSKNFVNKQRTLKNTIRATGVGLHTGDKIYLTLRPAPVDSGIVFHRVDLEEPVDVQACPQNVTDTRFSTTIEKDGAELIFICTHNSRRSQFGQVWAHTASLYYRMNNIRSYSGGTESTAIPPGTLTAIERAGFGIEKTGGPDGNPRLLPGRTSAEGEGSGWGQGSGYHGSAGRT